MSKTRRECRQEAVERLRKLHDGKKIHSTYNIMLALLEETDADWSAEKDFEKLFYMLGEDTCQNVHEPPKNTTFWPAPHFKCSVCGEKHVSIDYVYYCPNCGAKVV